MHGTLKTLSTHLSSEDMAQKTAQFVYTNQAPAMKLLFKEVLRLS